MKRYIKCSTLTEDEYNELFNQAVEQIEWSYKIGEMHHKYDIDEIGEILEKFIDYRDLDKCFEYCPKFLYEVREALS